MVVVVVPPLETVSQDPESVEPDTSKATGVAPLAICRDAAAGTVPPIWNENESCGGADVSTGAAVTMKVTGTVTGPPDRSDASVIEPDDNVDWMTPTIP